jgi:hypothetical protein
MPAHTGQQAQVAAPLAVALRRAALCSQSLSRGVEESVIRVMKCSINLTGSKQHACMEHAVESSNQVQLYSCLCKTSTCKGQDTHTAHTHTHTF